MSGFHPKTDAWDMKVYELVCRVDEELEKTFGKQIHLRINRPAAGTTASPQMDGAFNLGLVFTAGFGSEYGRGYSLDLEIAASEYLGQAERRQYELTAKSMLEAALRDEFPGRNLHFVEDCGRWKLLGNFNLGEI